MSYAIQDIKARMILDSRGQPTVEADVILTGGILGRAAVPSGASTGKREALELRDHDPHYYLGKGVKRVLANIDEIIKPVVLGQDYKDQTTFDEALLDLDGTSNKSNLGANTILALSMAFAHANAAANHLPLYTYLKQTDVFSLPVPMMNVINGGVHANNNLDIQEFMIMPVGAPSFYEAIRYGAEVFQALKALLKRRGFSTAVGDEGGFAPDLPSHDAALEFLAKAVEQAGFKLGRDIFFTLDIASSEFYQDGVYKLISENQVFDRPGFLKYLQTLLARYPIISLEDAMAEDDWEGWALLTSALGDYIQLVGDDVFVTNTDLLRQGIDSKIANAILIKPNQVGTLTETFEAIQLAKTAGYRAVMSHRSGETEDTTIADLAVATGIGQIKTGSLCRTDRVAKYNQLLRIEENLGKEAIFAGQILIEAIKHIPEF